MKPFNKEAAQKGAPVATREGRPARIIAYDRRANFPIVALIEGGHIEEVYEYYEDGSYSYGDTEAFDLVMVTTKKSGWINIFSGYVNTEAGHIYPSEEAAKAGKTNHPDYKATIHIEWEE